MSHAGDVALKVVFLGSGLFCAAWVLLDACGVLR